MADRNDAYMQQYPEKGIDIIEKVGERNGKYFSPELYGQPADKAMFYSPNTQNVEPYIIQSPTSDPKKKVSSFEAKEANNASQLERKNVVRRSNMVEKVSIK